MLWYDSIIDWMLLNPGRSKKECAAALGRTPQIIYDVTNSDLFKARYEFRRSEHNQALAEGTRAKLGRVADLAMDVLLDKLETKSAQLGAVAVAGIADSALQRLGYGIEPLGSRAAPVNATVVVQVSQTVLREAQANLRSLERTKLLEGVVVEHSPLSSSEDVGSRFAAEGNPVESGSTKLEDVPL
jgi:hypothetical protein